MDDCYTHVYTAYGAVCKKLIHFSQLPKLIHIMHFLFVFTVIFLFITFIIVIIYIYTQCPKKIVPFFYFFFPRCPMCGEWCKLH